MGILLEIITPERKAYEKTVDDVNVPTVDGHIGVLGHHVPLFTILTEGEIKISEGNREFYLAIGGGFMEVTRDRVSILVSRAVHADELNEAEIKKAQNQASDLIANRARGAELSAAQAVLRRSVLEMKVLRRRGRRVIDTH